ncbi:MAG: acyltransferase [Deltaproteobacteria bacterium]|nr:acyltransferase [Deltaproteobacteria bacterium]
MPLSPLSDPPGIWPRFLGNLRAAASLAFLFSTLLMFNAAQTLSLLLRPFSRRAFRAFNRWGANTWWGWCDILAEKAYGIRVELTGDELPEAENAVVIVNHQQMTDITVIFRVARRKRRLGDLKWFVKDIIKYFPGVGWGMLFLDCIFIKRDWLRDEGKIRRTFSRILDHKVPAWIMSFVEGTRLKPSKLAQSQKYAAGHGLPVLRHLMTPRTKGFAATVQALRGHATAVYDFTIGYVGGVPTLLQWAKGYARLVHVHARRFPIDDLPANGDELAAWLHARFEEKDHLLDGYYRDGAFPK